jgi:hypothetical protein
MRSAVSGSKSFRERRERRKLIETALVVTVAVEAVVVTAAHPLPDALEHRQLQLEHFVAVDHAVAVQRAPGFRRGRESFDLARARDLFNPEVQRTAESAARGKVRTRLLRNEWAYRRERIDQRDTGSLLARPAAEPSQIRKIADAPAAARTGGIQLNHPSPSPESAR